MMRQVSRPVRRGAGGKGRKDLARSLPYYHKAWAADQRAQREARRATRDTGDASASDLSLCEHGSALGGTRHPLDCSCLKTSLRG